MKSTFLWISLALVWTVTSKTIKDRPPIDPAATSFSGVLSLNWTAGYCFATAGTQNECDPAKLRLWDSKSFTVHGLWPSSATQASFQDFNLEYVEGEKALMDSMQNLWPPQTNYPILDPSTADTFDPHWLWRHEWNKHGKDFANTLQVLNPEQWLNASSSELQVEYFRTALALFNNKYWGLQKMSRFPKRQLSSKLGRKGCSYTISKGDLAGLLNIPESHFLAKCGKEDVLSEVHICWREEGTRGVHDLACSKIQQETIYPLTDSCPPIFQLVQYGSYGWRRQARVTRRTRNGRSGRRSKGADRGSSRSSYRDDSRSSDRDDRRSSDRDDIDGQQSDKKSRARR